MLCDSRCSLLSGLFARPAFWAAAPPVARRVSKERSSTSGLDAPAIPRKIGVQSALGLVRAPSFPVRAPKRCLSMHEPWRVRAQSFPVRAAKRCLSMHERWRSRVHNELLDCKLVAMKLTLEGRVLGVVMVLAMFDLVGCGETGTTNSGTGGWGGSDGSGTTGALDGSTTASDADASSTSGGSGTNGGSSTSDGSSASGGSGGTENVGGAGGAPQGFGGVSNVEEMCATY